MKVGRGPDSKEDSFGKHVGGGEVFAGVEKRTGGYGFDFGNREGRLKPLLGAEVCWDDVVVAVVELTEVWPPLAFGTSVSIETVWDGYAF